MTKKLINIDDPQNQYLSAIQPLFERNNNVAENEN
jgi:hypothetical protein